ncbi:MAG TPA: SAM-dependent methyltransferase [Thermoanaerobaculia bacterium]|nr:SAM-dependent methyltransferase [Thermoanaerobaculia bacterium]
MSLSERLRDRIAREGPISFYDFMRAALYDPEEGYYGRGAAIGEGGDFVTSPYVSPAFARALARLFAVETAAFEGPIDFVEVGAGAGRFLEDFTRALEALDPDLHARLRLTAVEASETARRVLGARPLSPAPRVLADAEELEPGSVRGWVFSNELYDALPVARVVGSAEGLLELRVAWKADRFAWEAVQAAEALKEHLARFGVELAAGQKGEVAPDAAPLHRRLARALDRGSLVAFDYGHPSRILYHPFARGEGTLAVHAGGRRGGDPLDSPGERDLTAHVNWDVLLAVGQEEGLRADRLMRQGLFLSEIGILDFAGSDAEKWRIFRLLDPEGMGEEISVLVQRKGMASGPRAD